MMSGVRLSKPRAMCWGLYVMVPGRDPPDLFSREFQFPLDWFSGSWSGAGRRLVAAAIVPDVVFGVPHDDVDAVEEQLASHSDNA